MTSIIIREGHFFFPKNVGYPDIRTGCARGVFRPLEFSSSSSPSSIGQKKNEAQSSKHVSRRMTGVMDMMTSLAYSARRHVVYKRNLHTSGSRAPNHHFISIIEHTRHTSRRILFFFFFNTRNISLYK